MRQPALPWRAKPHLVAGEELLVTREFRDEVSVEKGTHSFLSSWKRGRKLFPDQKEMRPLFLDVALPGARLAHLVHARGRPGRALLWACVRRRPWSRPNWSP